MEQPFSGEGKNRRYGFILIGVWALCALAAGGRPFPVWAAVTFLLWGVIAIYRVSSDLSFQLKVFLAWLAVSVLASCEPVASLWVLGATLSCAAFYLAVASSFSEGHKEMLARIVAALGYLFALAVWTDKFFGTAVHNLFLPPNPNYIAALMAAGAASSCALMLDKSYPAAKRQALFVFTLITLSGIILLKSRGAFISFTVGAAAAVVLARGAKTLKWVLPSALLMLLCGLFLKSGEPFAFERIRIWGSALKVMWDNPFFGIGPGCFGRGFALFNFPAFNGISQYGHYADYAHSHLFNMAAETGVMGAILYIYLCVSSLVKKPSGVTQTRIYVMLLVLFVNSLVEGVLLCPAIALLFFGLLACIDGARGEKILCLKMAVGMSIALSVLGLKYYSISLSERVGDIEEPFESRAESVRSLIKLYPRDASLYASLAGFQLAKDPANPFSADELLSRAQSLNPSNALYHLQRGQITFRLGNIKEAEREFELAAYFEPNCLEAYLGLAAVYSGRGEKEKAQAVLLEMQRREQETRWKIPQSGYDRSLLAYNRGLLLSLQSAESVAVVKKTGRK